MIHFSKSSNINSDECIKAKNAFRTSIGNYILNLLWAGDLQHWKSRGAVQ